MAVATNGLVMLHVPQKVSTAYLFNYYMVVLRLLKFERLSPFKQSSSLLLHQILSIVWHSLLFEHKQLSGSRSSVVVAAVVQNGRVLAFADEVLTGNREVWVDR